MYILKPHWMLIYLAGKISLSRMNSVSVHPIKGRCLTTLGPGDSLHRAFTSDISFTPTRPCRLTPTICQISRFKEAWTQFSVRPLISRALGGADALQPRAVMDTCDFAECPPVPSPTHTHIHGNIGEIGCGSSQQRMGKTGTTTFPRMRGFSHGLRPTCMPATILGPRRLYDRRIVGPSRIHV